MDPAALEPPRFDPQRRRAVLLALSLVTILASFEATVVSTAMPTIIGELEGLPLYSWVFAVYLLISIVVFLLGPGACALARSMPQLILARGLQGLGAGGLVPTSLTVTADLYSVRERARVQGLFSTLWGTASLLGPLLGAFMTVTFGWRSIFSINLPLGVLSFLLVARNLKESRAARSDPFDFGGALTLGVGVTALLFAVLHGTGGLALSLGIRAGLLATGVLALFVFARLQAAREHPLVPLGFFRGGKPEHPTSAAPFSVRPSSASTPSCPSSCRAPGAAPRPRRERWSLPSCCSGRCPPAWPLAW